MKENIVTKDGGYLIQHPELKNYPWVLGVQGSPYRIGFQHGYLLADLIRTTASGFLSPIYAQFGGWSPESGEKPHLDQMNAGRETMFAIYQKYFEPIMQQQAPDLLEEMNGIADGLKQADTDIPREDILIGNCIPEITELPLYFPDTSSDERSVAIEPKGCSDCIVWGRATKTGGLIHGSNYDYSTFNVLHKGIGIIVVKPEDGHAFLAQCLAGMVGFYRGINTQKMTVGENTSDSADRDIKHHARIPHAMHQRQMIQKTKNLQDAVDIMHHCLDSTGFNHPVGDGKVPSAIDIEASCTQIGLIKPQEGQDALWSTNQFVAYSGFKGYEGQNLAEAQVRWWNTPIENAGTVEDWIKMVRKETDKRSFSWQRYEMLGKMVKDNYGEIDVDKMIEMLSVWPLARDPQDLGQLSEPCDQLYGLHGPISDKKLASVFSAVFDTEDMTAWVAVGAEPAQSGPFWPIRLMDYLKLFEEPALEEHLPAVDNNACKTFIGKT